jgi:hypothetical protein
MYYNDCYKEEERAGRIGEGTSKIRRDLTIQ